MKQRKYFRTLFVFLAFFLFFAFFHRPLLTASAYHGINDLPPDILGVVLSNQDGFLEVLDEGDDEEDEPIVWTAYIGDALIYDLLTGMPSFPGAIAEGMPVRVLYTYPSGAATVWLHCGEDGAAALKASVSENIQYYEDGCNFLTGDGKYRVNLSPDMYIIDPDCGLIAPQDIRPGQEMFLWVDMVTASCPAQAYPDKVVLIRR